MTLIPPTSSKPGASYAWLKPTQNQCGGKYAWQKRMGYHEYEKKKKKGLLVLDEWGTRRSRMPVSSKESGSPSHEHPPPFFFLHHRQC